jgi:hypothetical protein
VCGGRGRAWKGRCGLADYVVHVYVVRGSSQHSLAWHVCSCAAGMWAHTLTQEWLLSASRSPDQARQAQARRGGRCSQRQRTPNSSSSSGGGVCARCSSSCGPAGSGHGAGRPAAECGRGAGCVQPPQGAAGEVGGPVCVWKGAGYTWDGGGYTGRDHVGEGGVGYWVWCCCVSVICLFCCSAGSGLCSTKGPLVAATATQLPI